ncbi:MAG: hypothetical protein Q6L58_10670, partial [Thermostichales cyanobacterium BF3_bins_165]
MKGWRLLLWLGCFLATLGLVLPLWAQEVAPPPPPPPPPQSGGGGRGVEDRGGRHPPLWGGRVGG